MAAAGVSTAMPHPHDISPEVLDAAMAVAERPDLLARLAAIGRRAFGFFPPHIQYTRNYPWAAARLEALPEGAQVLDIGAGLSPLPLFLTERGVQVDCVDGNPVVRTPPTADDWNEWGFFDYGQLHPGLRAHHCTVAAFSPPCRYDAIYAICVVAHMPAAERRTAFALCRRWLKPKGTLVLAIDLLPGTEFLWNKPVEEAPEEHGRIADIVHELVCLGFDVGELEVTRNLPGARTDLLFLAGTLGEGPALAQTDPARPVESASRFGRVPPAAPGPFSYWTGADHEPISDFLADWRSNFADFGILGDADVEPLIERWFPQHLEMFRHIRIPTCKSDLALLAALYDRGGLYLDCNCAVRDAAATRRLMARLRDYELILYERCRRLDPRPADVLKPLNSILLARPRSEIVLACARTAFLNCAAQWRREREVGFSPYDVWELSGPGVLYEVLLVPSLRRLRDRFADRVLLLQEGAPDAPIERYVHKRYRNPDMHWSARQRREPLFA